MKKLAGVLIILLCVSGCAQNSSYGPQNEGYYYPMCYSPLQQAHRLDSRARSVLEGMGRGLLGGLLAGAVGGAVSSLFTGNAMNIVSGAAIGAAGGTAAGGIYGGTQSNQAEKDALIAQWSQEAGTPLEGLGFNGAAATASLNCYNNRLNDLQKEIRDGLITQAAAEPRLVEIELGRQQAYTLLQQGNTN